VNLSKPNYSNGKQIMNNNYELTNQISEAEFSEEEFHDFNERAGIMEFDGNIPMRKAEYLAFKEVMRMRQKRDEKA